MAKIITIANSKSGLGKSSLLNQSAITFSLAPLNKKVLLIDATEDASLSYLNVLKENQLYALTKCKSEDVAKLIANTSEMYDLILLDLPSDISSPGIKSALLCCDLVVVPSSASLFDQIASKQFIDIVSEVQKVKKSKGYNLSMKMLPVMCNNSEAEELKALWKKSNLNYFTSPLAYNKELARLGEQFEPVIDYVTDGVIWTEDEQVFHEVFVELNELVETI